MDNIIQKFYSNGKESNIPYTQFGAFSSGMIANQNPITSLSIKTINDIKPAINPNSQKKLQYKTYTPLKPRGMTQEEFLRPKNLMFNSSSDMLYNNLRYNQPGEIRLMKEDLSLMNKKNATKIQMIEEKMKNLELKNQRLEVINDFFFDMFENNLVKDEIKRKRKAKNEENKILYEDNSEYCNDNENNNYYKSKRKKFKKSRSDINLNTYDRYIRYNNKKEFDPVEFQQITAQNARNVLNNIKKNLGTYLVEEELKKNEQFQTLSEGINELKTDLNQKLDKIQQNQKQQMQKIYYCLLNSGEKNIENVALRLLEDYSNKNIDLMRKIYDKDNESNSKNDLSSRHKYKQNSFRTNLSSMSLLKNK